MLQKGNKNTNLDLLLELLKHGALGREKSLFQSDLIPSRWPQQESKRLTAFLSTLVNILKNHMIHQR